MEPRARPRGARTEGMGDGGSGCSQIDAIEEQGGSPEAAVSFVLFPKGGSKLRAWVSGAPHLVPTESGPTVCMTSSINHSSPHAP